MLLEVDIIDDPWVGTKSQSSSWEREIGQLEEDNVPLALRRLVTPGTIHSYDGSAVGARLNRVLEDLEEDDVEDANEGNEDEDANNDSMDKALERYRTNDEVRVVSHMSLKYFRSCLDEHFNIIFKEGKVE